MAPSPLGLRVRFSVFEVDRSASQLLKRGRLVKLAPQPVKVLLLLLDRHGQVVSRNDIQRHLWGESTFVDFERGINFSINQIRAALGDDAEKPRYIETLPKLGYRFVAEVTDDAETEPAVLAAQAVESESELSDLSGREAHPPGPPPPTMAHDESVIQTVPTREDRFVGAVTAVAPTALAATEPSLRPWWRSPLMWAGGILAAFGLLVVTGRVWNSPVKPAAAAIVAPQQVQIRKLTDNDQAMDAAISPDGRYVIFVRGDARREGLWLRQIDTRTDVEILHADGTDFHGLTFSPDGSLIYFVKSHRDNPGSKSLYAMSILGGAARMVIKDIDGPVSFSPDGKEFVYEWCSPAGIELRTARVERDADRELAVIRDAECALFQPGPRWSPDGRTVAVPALLRTEPPRSILASVSVADGTQRVLHSCICRFGRPAWIAGGQALLVPHAEENFTENQLWTVTFPGGEATRVTDNLTSYDMALDGTPDGRLAVSTVITRTSNIWVAPAGDPSRAHQVSDGLPLWMATELVNGQLLAVGFDGKLWSMGPDGSQRVQFSSLRDVDSFVRCGHTVVASAEGPSGTVTYVLIDMDGTRTTPLITGNLRARVACGDAGDFLFFVRRVPASAPVRLFKLPLAGGAAMEVGHGLPVDAAWLVGVSPDETQLAFLERVPQPARDGWRVDLVRSQDGAPVASWPVHFPAYYPQQYRWTPEGLAWQFLQSDNGVFNVWEQQLAGGAPRQLTKFTSGRIFRFEWSIDAKRLVMTRGSISHDVVLLNLQ